MPKKLVIWYFLAQIFRLSKFYFPARPRGAGKWRVPGRLGSSVPIAGKFFYALAAVIVILLIHGPYTPFNHLSPWTNFSTPLLAPSHTGTSGPRSPRRSVIRRLRLSKIFAGCLPMRLRTTTKNNDDNEQRRRLTTTNNDEQRRRQTTMTTNNYDDDVDNKFKNTTINISPSVMSSAGSQ